MNCSDCSQIAQSMCKECPGYKFFCAVHIIAHLQETSHPIHQIDKKIAFQILSKSIRSEIESCIIQITSETSKIITSLKKASKNSINQLKDMNKNLISFKDFTFIHFDTIKVSNIIEQSDSLAKLREKVDYSLINQFQQMNLAEKNEFCQKTWNCFRLYDGLKEILISNDGKFLFQCKSKEGTDD